MSDDRLLYDTSQEKKIKRGKDNETLKNEITKHKSF